MEYISRQMEIMEALTDKARTCRYEKLRLTYGEETVFDDPYYTATRDVREFGNYVKQIRFCVKGKTTGGMFQCVYRCAED